MNILRCGNNVGLRREHKSSLTGPLTKLKNTNFSFSDEIGAVLETMICFYLYVFWEHKERHKEQRAQTFPPQVSASFVFTCFSFLWRKKLPVWKHDHGVIVSFAFIKLLRKFRQPDNDNGSCSVCRSRFYSQNNVFLYRVSLYGLANVRTGFSPCRWFH